MTLTLILIWITLFVALGTGILVRLKVIRYWPKIYIVSFLSNMSILGLYYCLPNLVGLDYYFVNVLKTAPLVILLVYFAQHDPKQNWSYRAMCWVLITQIITSCIHMWSELTFIYYDELSFTSTVAELIILLVGGHNARITNMDGDLRSPLNTTFGGSWAKRHIEHRER